MSKLPRLSGRECIRVLERAGFVVISQRGSHVKMRRELPYAQVVVPLSRELDTGTLRNIIRQANISVEEFVGLL